MGLLDLARRDAKMIINKVSAGFAESITLTNPNGVTAVMDGLFADAHDFVNFVNEEAVSTRYTHVTLSKIDIDNAAIGIPTQILEYGAIPWTVTCAAGTFKVTQVKPNSLGVYLLELEDYQP